MRPTAGRRPPCDKKRINICVTMRLVITFLGKRNMSLRKKTEREGRERGVRWRYETDEKERGKSYQPTAKECR